MKLNVDQTLTLRGLYELHLRVQTFCTSEGYPPWRFKHEYRSTEALDAAVSAWTLLLQAELDEYLSAVFWLQRAPSVDGEMPESERISISHDEALAWLNCSRSPSRDWHTFELLTPDQQWSGGRLRWVSPPEPIRLREMLRNAARVDMLLYRLDKGCIAPYSAADWALLTAESAGTARVVWTDMNGCHHSTALMALDWPSFGCMEHAEYAAARIVLPSAWLREQAEAGGWGELPVVVDSEGVFNVFDAAGVHRFMRWGQDRVPSVRADATDTAARSFVAVEVLPRAFFAHCQERRTGAGSVFEVNQTALVANAHGDIESALVISAKDGGMLPVPLPGGIVVLAGTLGYEGCLVARYKNTAEREVAWLMMSYIRSCAIRPTNDHTNDPPTLHWWRAVRSASERLRPVQCSVTGLWGWAEQNGAPCIAPRFARVGGFDDGLAWAHKSLDAVREDAPTAQCVGLVDRSGEWVVAPEWRDIRWRSKRCIVVRNTADEWGALALAEPTSTTSHPLANVAVLPQPTRHWLEKFAAPEVQRWLRRSPRSLPETDADRVVLVIECELSERKFEWVQRAKRAPSLAALAGIFDGTTTVSDLAAAGVWMLPVMCIGDATREVNAGGAIDADRPGRIFFAYPVSLSLFDLAQEAPVSGLRTNADAVMGVPWCELRWRG